MLIAVIVQSCEHNTTTLNTDYTVTTTESSHELQ